MSRAHHEHLLTARAIAMNLHVLTCHVWGGLPHLLHSLDYTAELDMTSPWMKSIDLACRFVAETLSHAKEKGCFPQYIHQLKALFSNYLPACKYVCRALAPRV